MNQFPLFQQYLEATAQREHGMELIAMIAFAAVVWLWLARFQLPRLLPFVRWGLLAAFYITLVVSIFIRR